jgi:hypothetical protein
MVLYYLQKILYKMSDNDNEIYNDIITSFTEKLKEIDPEIAKRFTDQIKEKIKKGNLPKTLDFVD